MAATDLLEQQYLDDATRDERGAFDSFRRQLSDVFESEPLNEQTPEVYLVPSSAFERVEAILAQVLPSRAEGAGAHSYAFSRTVCVRIP